MNAVELDHVSKWFDRREGGPLHVLDTIDIAIPQHAIVAVLNASGCGKSTLLNMIAGLVEPDQGAVLLDGIPSHAFRDWRAMTYMFQEDRLLPWRTAAQNVAFGLEAGRMSRAKRARRVDDTLRLVGLDTFPDAYPHELSGGMRSRVALARSLVTEPRILLRDEPFSRLDPEIRAQTHAELLCIAALRAMTLVFVTHDVEEAVVLERHPSVLQACVVPVDDAIKGTKPVAFVVRRPGALVDEAALKAHALAHAPAYQHPRRVWFVDALPLASTGKIDRAALRLRAEQAVGRA